MAEVAAALSAGPAVAPPPLLPAAAAPPADALARLSLSSGSGRAQSAPQPIFQYLPESIDQVGTLPPGCWCSGAVRPSRR